MIKFTICWFLIVISLACERTPGKNISGQKTDSGQTDPDGHTLPVTSPKNTIEPTFTQEIKGVTGHKIVDFAQTLLGIPYSYASIDPIKGFDCSGFITYVFRHFNIAVPRSSIDFTHAGKEVDLPSAKEGDLILFTGTIDSIRTVGHMGIVTENIDTLKFIHATSGKAYGVTISVLNERYKRRFVKITRILSD